MERHGGCRKGGKGYPCRAIRTSDHLYIHNFEPTRWLSGSPDSSVCARAIPYGEIDSSPSNEQPRRISSPREDPNHLAKTTLRSPKKSKDPHVIGGPVNWDHYPYYGVIHTKGWSVNPAPTLKK